MKKEGARIVIMGKVQGVFFRLETQKTAKRLGVSGWVRNQPDGSVAALAEGEKSNVEALIEWCRSGPPLANVSKVDVDWVTFSGEHSGFEVKY